jgi:hypothetical protein
VSAVASSGSGVQVRTWREGTIALLDLAWDGERIRSRSLPEDPFLISWLHALQAAQRVLDCDHSSQLSCARVLSARGAWLATQPPDACRATIARGRRRTQPPGECGAHRGPCGGVEARMRRTHGSTCAQGGGAAGAHRKRGQNGGLCREQCSPTQGHSREEVAAMHRWAPPPPKREMPSGRCHLIWERSFRCTSVDVVGGTGLQYICRMHAVWSVGRLQRQHVSNQAADLRVRRGYGCCNRHMFIVGVS